MVQKKDPSWVLESWPHRVTDKEKRTNFRILTMYVVDLSLHYTHYKPYCSIGQAMI